MAHDLIDSAEMYLRTVLELEEEGIPALRARLTERLGLSAPTISEGVARLEDQGLVQLTEDRTVRLTDQGRERAEHVMRKHRLAERLLVDVLGLEHEYVHEEACRWEHVISDRVEERLVEVLGQPATSPYGNPIPGLAEPRDQVTALSRAGDGPARLHSISESLQGDVEVIQLLHEHGMRPGELVTVTKQAGGVVLEHGGQRVELPLDAAKLVYVVRVEDGAPAPS